MTSGVPIGRHGRRHASSAAVIKGAEEGSYATGSGQVGAAGARDARAPSGSLLPGCMAVAITSAPSSEARDPRAPSRSLVAWRRVWLRSLTRAPSEALRLACVEACVGGGAIVPRCTGALTIVA